MSCDSWNIVGASVQGTSHVAQGLPCQDAHLWRILPDGRLILAVADGAGSAPLSAEGAQQAVLVATEALSASLFGRAPADDSGWAAVMLEAYRAARDALGQMAMAARRPIREFATTLACAVVSDGWLVTGQLGDGWMVAEKETGELWAATRPQRGEYANEAYFLTMDGALDYLDVLVCRQQVHALAASTDGLLRLALRLPAYEPHTPFFRPLFGFAAEAGPVGEAQAQLVHFLDSPQVCARADDDKTLVLVARAARRPTETVPTPLLLAGPTTGDGAL